MNKTLRTSLLVLSLTLVPAWAALAGPAPTVEMSVGAASIDWQAASASDRWVLTVSSPDGKVMRQEVKGSPSFGLFDGAGNRRPDGQYRWELRAVPQIDPAVRKQLADARAQGRSAAVEAELRKAGKLPPEQVQSGSFAIIDGTFVGPGLRETGNGPQVRPQKQMTNITAADQVIPDDLIVQQSLCVGFDCVNNESFGFDTIRLKENNTRIKFEDTSTGSFPTNDWQLTANDSASGGASKFSIEDITGSKVPFTVTAGASTNSIFVDSTGRVGFRTSTPVLDLHVATSNTPAIRLEQNNSGGFTAQTWDIGANEANFFVRDVTGGSKLSFRIRPGAPTSSVDISASGNVGIGTASPADKMDIQADADGATAGRIGSSSATGFSGWEYEDESGAIIANLSHDNSGNTFRLNVVNSEPFVILTNSTERIRFPAPGGNVITAANGAFLSSGGTWTNASSRAYKKDIVELDASEAVAAVKKLDPVKFKYNAEPGEQYVGFIAEDVPDLVAMNDRKSLSSMDVVAVLTKVVQEQQKTIEALSAKVGELEKANQK